MADKWTPRDIPDQSGRTALVTGANSGLGRATARELARAGATVILTARSFEKGEQAIEAVREEVPEARLELEQLDLANLTSIRELTGRLPHERLDLLVNNAGVMAPPRRTTKDGFESQIGTNHLGHFALTGLLLPRLLSAPEPRVVTVSSGAHRIGKIDFEDLNSEHGYSAWRAYGQSKLANLMFCFELQRRASAAAVDLKSMAAHPGYAATNLQSAGTEKAHEKALMALTNKLIAQSADMGALSTLYAATVPDLPGATFVGPDGFLEQRGHPHVVTAAGKAYQEEDWRRLWELSEKLTGVGYEFSVPAGGPAAAG